MLKPAIFTALCLSFSVSAATAAATFKKDIAPILKKKCYECHSEASGKEKSGYVFDNLARLATDIGPKGQIVPGDVERSNLIDLMSKPEGEKGRMPPNNKEGLTKKELDAFREWIAAGAVLEGKGAPPPAAAVKPAAAPAATPQAWTSADGKVIQATFLKLEADTVHLKMANGQVYKVPLARLNEESQTQAKAAGTK